MYVTCKTSTAYLKLIDNPIISSDTSNVCGELCWLTWPQNQEASGSKQRLIVCVLSVTEWLVSTVDTRILIRVREFKNANKTLPPLRILFPSEPLTHFFAEISLRKIGVVYWPVFLKTVWGVNLHYILITQPLPNALLFYIFISVSSVSLLFICNEKWIHKATFICLYKFGSYHKPKILAD
jgi:hypothetical protein